MTQISITKALMMFFISAFAFGTLWGTTPANPCPGVVPVKGFPGVTPGKPLTILISFDGFRHDYLNRITHPGFVAYLNNCYRASSLKPVNPTKTFPNHWAIATGAYPRDNGIVGNSFYDSTLNDVFTMQRTESAWWRGTPLWIEAERRGLTAACAFWPGSETAFSGDRPTYWLPYEPSRNYHARIDSLLSWIDGPTPPRVATMYFEVLDDIGHREGPDSPNILEGLSVAGGLLVRIETELASRGLLESTNIIVVSDHGMTALQESCSIELESVMDTTGFRIIGSGNLVYLYRQPPPDVDSLQRSIAQRVQWVDVYAPNDSLSELHMDAPGRAPAAILMTKPGCFFVRKGRPFRGGGDHGHHNSHLEMHGVFFARGPAFTPGNYGQVSVLDVFGIVMGTLDR